MICFNVTSWSFKQKIKTSNFQNSQENTYIGVSLKLQVSTPAALSEKTALLILNNICNYFYLNRLNNLENFRSRHPEMFLDKGVLKLCSKFTGEHPCRSVISINLQSRETLEREETFSIFFFQSAIKYFINWTTSLILKACTIVVNAQN